MHKKTFTLLHDRIVLGDRAEALNILRSAIDTDKISARDGIELMLAVRQGSPSEMIEALESMKWGLPGAYRYVPKTEYAFA